MSYNFKNKKIIISAGASGIGWATAKECLDKGAKVFVCDVDKNSINKLKKNKGGSIVNLSSTAGIFGFPLRSPYSASKWAVVGMTKTLAMELGKFKIRVNAICPGTVKGDRMGRVIRDKAKFLKISKKAVESEFVSMTSLNTWVYEKDIGKMCCYLISVSYTHLTLPTSDLV